MNKKYKVTVSDWINCSSSGHYFGTVKIDAGKKRDTRHFELDNWHLMYKDANGVYKGYPQYVHDEINKQYKQMLDDGELVVYEYNQEGNKRFDNLRYHDQERLADTINYWVKQ